MPSSGTRLNVTDSRKIREMLRKLSPKDREGVTANALERIARVTETEAKTRQIVRGRGKTAPPLANKLTFRSGRLTRSISTDLSQLPKRAIVGSSVRYAPVHELGLQVRRRGGTAQYPKRAFLKPAAELTIKRRGFEIFRREYLKARRIVG